MVAPCVADSFCLKALAHAQKKRGSLHPVIRYVALLIGHSLNRIFMFEPNRRLKTRNPGRTL